MAGKSVFRKFKKLEKFLTLRDLKDSEVLDTLESSGLLDQRMRHRIETSANSGNTPIESRLIQLGFVSEQEVFDALSAALQVPLIDVKDIDWDVTRRLDLKLEFLKQAEVFPTKFVSKDKLMVAVCNYRSVAPIESIKFHTGLEVSAALMTPSSFRHAIAELEGMGTENQPREVSTDLARLENLENDGPIIELTRTILSDAVLQGASDLHIEPRSTEGTVRLRVDGKLRTLRKLSNEECERLVSRIKVLAELNISERNLPQDGRCRTSVLGRDIDLRISTLPTPNGESLVVRLLDPASLALGWSSLGFAADRAEEICSVLQQPNGLFLVAGPTGSGKTTTLYTAISHLQSDDTKIVTVEDPIEYELQGITQIQVRPKFGLTFARALRAILRHDPNVVLVGEIRDQETAEIAVRAALIGRMVLSTVHTNDSLSAIDRLLDLGVPNYLIASVLRGVLSQRLLPKICIQCNSTGCERCNNVGVDGRELISELLVVPRGESDELARVKTSAEIPKKCPIRSFVPMTEEATQKVQRGKIREKDVVRFL